MKVSVDIHHTDFEGDYGQVHGLGLVCERCGHKVEVAGTGDASARRGAQMLRDECPKGESNYYDVGRIKGCRLHFESVQHASA
jgi:hypothetical protein